MTPIRLVRQDPALRLAALLITLYGALLGTLAPYVSTLAVEVFGLDDADFGAVLAVASGVSAVGAIGLGIRADQSARRRPVALFTLGLMVCGLALVSALRSPLSFVLAHAVLLPASTSLFGQVFALARLAAACHPPQARDGIMAVVRAGFALGFVAVVPVWSVAFGAGADLGVVQPAALAVGLCMVALVARHWPRDGATPWVDRPSGLRPGAALAEMLHPRIAARVLALGAVNGAVMLYIALVGLSLTQIAGRSAADVALYVGIVAGLEVPLMLALPRIMGRASRGGLIWLGACVYGAHLAAIPWLAPTGWLWLLTLPGAAGGALILTLPIAYLQDLLGDRPGAGGALMALQKLAGDASAALSFSVGTWAAGYGLAAGLGAGLAVAGASALWLMDRRAGRAGLASI